MKTIIFEDEKWEKLVPISYIRPVFEMRCGYYELIERIQAKLPDMEETFWVREYLIPVVKNKYGKPVNDTSAFDNDILLINGRWLIQDNDDIDTDTETVHTCGEDILFAVLKKETVNKLWNDDFNAFLRTVKDTVTVKPREALLVNYPWNLVHYNTGILSEDFSAAGKTGCEGTFSGKAVIYGPENLVYIAPGAEVHPLAVIDTTTGPVFIDKDAVVYPNARIEGPCYIGKQTLIMPGANIREGNSFGPICRIGGEVEESIFHSYSSKYHDGFIGHSYIGEFVNLGALTTNSDLKNDYSPVSVYINGKPINTNELKVGSFIGDHTKTSIGTLLNTGTSAGLMCNITASGILPKFFPSFTWYINGKFMKGFGVKMMIETAKTAMGRRDRTLSPEEEQVIQTVYEMTKEVRKEYIKKSRRK